MLSLSRYNIFYTSLVCLFSLPLFSTCKTQTVYNAPAGYDFNLPNKFVLSPALHEVSGITFIDEKKDFIYAVDDEEGKLFGYNMQTEKISHSKFGKKGDFEDVSILNNNKIVVLRSDGSLFLFPVNEIEKQNIDSVKEFNNLLPAGEYEGLFAAEGKIFVLCKNCAGDKGKSEVSVQSLEMQQNDSLKFINSFKIDISMTQSKEGKQNKFHPSGISKNPVTNDWFIISSTNKLLLVLDEQWKVKQYFPLDPSIFKQPEGITFNSKGDLYISNEGIDGAANILEFPYNQQ